MERIIDNTLGISQAARSVMALLDEDAGFLPEDEEDVRFFTFAWYNGREKGIAVVMGHTLVDKTLVITFGECRGSDRIFVDSWEEKRSVCLYWSSPPIWKNMPDKAYDNRYDTNNPKKAYDKIISKMAAFYRAYVRARGQAGRRKRGKGHEVRRLPR